MSYKNLSELVEKCVIFCYEKTLMAIEKIFMKCVIFIDVFKDVLKNFIGKF